MLRNEQGNVELKLIHMEDVVSKEVEWLWYPYIPYGKITIIEGDPGESECLEKQILNSYKSLESVFLKRTDY